MNRFKFEAFKQEFPALQSLLVDRNERPRESRWCDSIQVKRLDTEFLNAIPSWNSWDGSVVGISKKETVSFALTDGSLIENAVHQSGEHGSNYAYSETCYNTGESVLEAIARHDCAALIKMAVVVRTGFTVREHYSEPNFSVVIYKAGKGEVIANLIAEAMKFALNEVRAEANF